MDSKRHGKLSGQRATVSRRVGGAFKVGQDLEGKHLALTKDRRIVQTWRATRITFTQTAVPDDKYGKISTGWREYYWNPLRKQFGAKRAIGR